MYKSLWIILFPLVLKLNTPPAGRVWLNSHIAGRGLSELQLLLAWMFMLMINICKWRVRYHFRRLFDLTITAFADQFSSNCVHNVICLFQSHLADCCSQQFTLFVLVKNNMAIMYIVQLREGITVKEALLCFLIMFADIWKLNIFALVTICLSK